MLAKCVNDDTFVSLEGKSKHQLWLELCDIITRHPREVTQLKVDAILRSGIRKFTDEVRGEIKKARHVLPSCMENCATSTRRPMVQHQQKRPRGTLKKGKTIPRNCALNWGGRWKQVAFYTAACEMLCTRCAAIREDNMCTESSNMPQAH